MSESMATWNATPSRQLLRVGRRDSRSKQSSSGIGEYRSCFALIRRCRARPTAMRSEGYVLSVCTIRPTQPPSMQITEIQNQPLSAWSPIGSSSLFRAGLCGTDLLGGLIWIKLSIFLIRAAQGRKTKQPRRGEGPTGSYLPSPRAYLRAVETLVNVVLSWVPKACTVAMIATAMPAAIRPYSIAVAPCSSLSKRFNMACALSSWSGFSLHTISYGLTKCEGQNQSNLSTKPRAMQELIKKVSRGKLVAGAPSAMQKS
jgi:hypothetical protein